jgi:hypothetical protein
VWFTQPMPATGPAGSDEQGQREVNGGGEKGAATVSAPHGDIPPHANPDKRDIMWASAPETAATLNDLVTPAARARRAGTDAARVVGPETAAAHEGAWAHQLPQTPRDHASVPAAAAPDAAVPSLHEDDAGAEDFEFVTGQMARLARDPDYARLQQLLARRRRRRALLVELTLALDLTVTFAALFLAQQYRVVLSHIVPVELFAHVWVFSDVVVLACLVAVIWPLTFSLLGLYRSGWGADVFSPLRAVAGVLLSSFAIAAMLYFLQADRTRWFLLSFTALDADRSRDSAACAGGRHGTPRDRRCALSHGAKATRL